jgi:asparagine synthase (glutamine-hydrolysing)
LISQKAKDEGVSVLLSGEGADELFGGYHFYKTYYKKTLMNGFPLLRDIYNRRRNIRKADYECAEKIHAYGALDRINSGFDREITSYLLKDLKHYIVPILRRTDRMSMGAGLEMRVPYLDNKMIDFCVNLPLEYKINFFHTKYLLKKVAERYLPKDIVYRKKMGFPLPAVSWLAVDNFKNFMYSEWKEMRSVKLNHVLAHI